MTTTDTTPTAAPLVVQVLDDDDIGHVVRDCDGDTALCGAPVPNHTWGGDDPDDVWCPECLALERDDSAHVAGCVFCQFAERIW